MFFFFKLFFLFSLSRSEQENLSSASVFVLLLLPRLSSLWHPFVDSVLWFSFLQPCLHFILPSLSSFFCPVSVLMLLHSFFVYLLFLENPAKTIQYIHKKHETSFKSARKRFYLSMFLCRWLMVTTICTFLEGYDWRISLQTRLKSNLWFWKERSSFVSYLWKHHLLSK